MVVDTASQSTSDAVSQPVWSLQRAMHRLWADHAIWTRDYVVAALADAADAQAAAGRLLRNQEDIGNAIVPLYGEEAGAKLTDLLKQHILIAVDLVDAAMRGDERRFEREDKRWDANAEEIAAFLAGANPNWPQNDVQDLLAQHLALTKQEVVARLEKDWEKDVAAFDDIMTEILTLSDALSDGIVEQFPEKFEPDHPSGDNGALSRPAWSLQRALHRLWADHVLWTRDYVVAALADAADAQAAAGRLLRNQEDIGNAIVPLYGEEAGKGLTLQLKQHILIAVDLIELVKAEDFGERFEELDRKWDDNAADIARFLSSLNPHWPEKDVHDLLAQHLALTKQEVDARLFGDWETDVARFDDIMTEILTLADALSAGIIQQFPERFEATSNGSNGDATSGESPSERRGWFGSRAKEGSARSQSTTVPRIPEVPAGPTTEPERPTTSRRFTRPAPISRSSSGRGRPGRHGAQGDAR